MRLGPLTCVELFEVVLRNNHVGVLGEDFRSSFLPVVSPLHTRREAAVARQSGPGRIKRSEVRGQQVRVPRFFLHTAVAGVRGLFKKQHLKKVSAIFFFS